MQNPGIKKLVFLVPLMVIGLLPIHVSSQTVPSCPTISIKAPMHVLSPENEEHFRVDFEGAKPHKLTYVWATSRGKIVSGEGTSEIGISFGQENAGVTIHVMVQVLSEGPVCSLFASEAADIGARIIIDYDYITGEISAERARAIMDNLFLLLGMNPDSQGLIYFWYDAKETPAQKLLRLRNLLQAIRFRRYDISRITFVISDCPRSTEISPRLAGRGTQWPNPPGQWTVISGTKLMKNPKLAIRPLDCKCKTKP